MIYFILYPLIAYLLGSIPTAVWVGKRFYAIDIREHGSKNAGATNTFRVLGKKPGTVVLFIDILKGAIAVSLPYFIGAITQTKAPYLVEIQLISGISAILGHIFPVFAGFKGGKGVATSLGIVIGIHPFTALVCMGLFLLVFLLSAMVSLGAIISAIAFPFVLHFVFGNTNSYLMAFSIVLSIAVIIAHHRNIRRIFKGEENKMNLFGKST
jgi:glycerol-3-phosphate acyltransferase PlsY